MDDPAEVDKRFTSMFKTGTPVLEKAIVKELQTRIGVIAAEQTEFDFQDGVKRLEKASAGRDLRVSQR